MQLIGLARLGRDCELRYTQDQQAVTNLSLAYNYGRKGEDGKRPVMWVDASLWGKLAEAISPYLLKGTSVCVTLDDVHLQTYKSQHGEGTKLVGKVTTIELAGSRDTQPAQRQQQPPPAQQPRQQQRHSHSGGGGFDDMDDDQSIPF